MINKLLGMCIDIWDISIDYDKITLNLNKYNIDSIKSIFFIKMKNISF